MRFGILTIYSDRLAADSAQIQDWQQKCNKVVLAINREKQGPL